ncbi:CMD domain-containing protein [Pseudomonas sp. Pseu.R1]|uniref:CMD domain-containing protein n=1 Tax=Pseudomonas sp. Pseu.R1 TaxID=3379818 RepID=UPI003B926E39
MSSTSPIAVTADVLDSLLDIQPGSALHGVRHARDKVALATQGSHNLFFAQDLGIDLSLTERLWVAYFAARLTPQATLCAYYLKALQAQGIDSDGLALIDAGKLDELNDGRLAAILRFTRTLIESPVHGDRAALQALQQQGLSTGEIVVLAQLIAFLSYQVRLAAGLSALSATGAA